MHEYFPNDAKQNFVMADYLWRLNCPKHCCLHALYAFERLFNTNNCFGNHQINADVMGTVPDTKNQLGGWVLLILLKQLLSGVFDVADGCVDQFVRGSRW